MGIGNSQNPSRQHPSWFYNGLLRLTLPVAFAEFSHAFYFKGA